MFSPSQNALNDTAAPGIDWDACMLTHGEELRDWVVRQFGGEEGVDDVMQEVALASVKSSNPPTEETKVLPWLKSVARHKVQDYWRKVGRDRRIQEIVSVEIAPSEWDWVLEVDRIEAVREALATLETNERRLVVGKYSENRSCLELAKREGVSPKSLEYRLAKAREKLRAQLTKLFRNENER